MKISSVYLHIPFCLRKCYYCDFASFPLPGRERELADYPSLLHKELELWQEEAADFAALETVYLGGGTPSLLPPDTVADILSSFPPVQEITLEANPETVDAAKLQAFRDAGVNRLSLGVQSFHDTLLSAMGRGHSGAQAKSAVTAARSAGFTNVSIDLIYGLPGQTLQQWREDLEDALSLTTEHISLYGLSLHEGTPWGDLEAKGELFAADEDTSADMLELAVSILKQQGFHHYEISNFARPGWESRHNTAYWQRKNYLGLGVAAASCLLNRRFDNVRDFDAYQSSLIQGKRPVAVEEILTMEQVLAEAVFLGLRMTEGISFVRFEENYGVNPRRYFKKQIVKLERFGLLAVDENGMRLTDRGLMLGNQAFAEFI